MSGTAFAKFSTSITISSILLVFVIYGYPQLQKFYNFIMRDLR